MSTLFQAPSLEGSRGRTLTTTLVSVGIYGGVIAFIFLAGAAAQSEVVQQKLEVIFRAPPRQTPPQEAAPPPPQNKPRSLRPIQATMQTIPLAIPDAPPTVSDPAPPVAVETQTAPPPADAPPAPPPKVREPINLPENATPPVADAGNVAPAFPEQALSMGKDSEALVILKIVVGEDGRVARVQVMKGDEPFVAAALAAVKSWHYSPALVDGQATAVFRIVKIPFRLRG